jgi:hypothetical protein
VFERSFVAAAKAVLECVHQVAVRVGGVEGESALVGAVGLGPPALEHAEHAQRVLNIRSFGRKPQSPFERILSGRHFYLCRRGADKSRRDMSNRGALVRKRVLRGQTRGFEKAFESAGQQPVSGHEILAAPIGHVSGRIGGARGPFEHNGSVATLEDWFDQRRLRSDYIPTGYKGYGVTTRAVPGHAFGLTLSGDDKAALIAFLKTL